MALTPEQIRNVALRSRQGRAAQKRLDAAPTPAKQKEHQKIAEGLMQRRNYKQRGLL